MNSHGNWVVELQRRPRVLVAGDVPLTIALLSTTLQLAGYPVTAASSCARVADHPAKAAVALLVIDATRRPLAAASAIERLRAAGSTLPIVALVPATPFAREVFSKIDVQVVIDSIWSARTLRNAVDDALDRALPRRPALSAEAS
jgi:CheY-like chemotaxis protein